jgi:hypothetical protein
MPFEGIPNMYQLASTRVGVLVKKTNISGGEAVIEGVLPWLTLYFDNNFNQVIAALIHYGNPDRKVLADLRSEVMMLDDDLRPDEVRIDSGVEFPHLAKHQAPPQFKYVTQCSFPSRKERVESFFQRLDTLWMTLPGYVGSHGSEHSREVTPQLTLDELKTFFEAFVRSCNRSPSKYY